MPSYEVRLLEQLEEHQRADVQSLLDQSRGLKAPFSGTHTLALLSDGCVIAAARLRKNHLEHLDANPAHARTTIRDLGQSPAGVLFGCLAQFLIQRGHTHLDFTPFPSGLRFFSKLKIPFETVPPVLLEYAGRFHVKSTSTPGVKRLKSEDLFRVALSDIVVAQGVHQAWRQLLEE